MNNETEIIENKILDNILFDLTYIKATINLQIKAIQAEYIKPTILQSLNKNIHET